MTRYTHYRWRPRAVMAAAATATLLGAAAGLAAAGPAGAAAAAPAAPRAAPSGPAAFGWGSNEFGQIGDGTTTEHDLPDRVLLSGTPTQVVSEFGTTGVALLSNGTVETWGWNPFGQLGNGTLNSSSTPSVVAGVSGIVQIAGGNSDTLALTSSGTVWSWGNDYNGGLGYGTPGSVVEAPHQVPGLTGVTQIAAGYNTGFALRPDGTVWAWGDNSAGQLGDGTTVPETAPQQVPGLTGVTKIAAGGDSVFAINTGGTLLGWGGGSDGALGLGDGADRRHPTPVPGIDDVQQVATSGVTTLAIAFPGSSLWGWGFNSQGQIGDGSTIPKLVPELTSLTGITQVSEGYEVSAAVRSDGTLLAWGANANGSVANGTSRTDQLTPAPVAGISNVTSVSVFDSLGLAVGRVPVPPPPTSGPVPRVTGDLRAAAITAIQDAGFSLGAVTSSPDRTCNNIGHVLSQNPPAGTTEPFGTAVSIVIGTRPTTPCP
jgi:alpha-tubulin suppressor-like RCC1 family protein